MAQLKSRPPITVRVEESATLVPRAFDARTSADFPFEIKLYLVGENDP